jgi:hypothetical protein
MIISASRRTDIPAFYSEWFMNRIAEGRFESVNPFNPSQVRVISLLPQDVDAVVFWSKNPEPMLKHLDGLDARGFRYYFQYTLNAYPGFLEPGIPSLDKRLDTFLRLSSRLGSKRTVWRYDPIIAGNMTPVEYHLERFAGISRRLSGYCERVVISFVDFYAKLSKRLDFLERSYGFSAFDITRPEYRDRLELLASGINSLASANGMKVYSCSEPLELDGWGIRRGSCIDADLINDIFHLDLRAKKDRNQRGGCLCAASVDMGAYNSCAHACRYCYANLNETLASKHRLGHDPKSPSLCR